MTGAPADPVDEDWPNVARMYDALLGGSHNLAVDRAAVAEMEDAVPRVRQIAHANRSLLRRVVHALVEAGVDQFLDLGSGIPTVGNVHEVAQQLNSAARVAYVDLDQVAVDHGRHLLAGNPNATAVRGDLRQPHAILNDPQVAGLLDFDRPVGVLLMAVLHFLPDVEDPAGIVAAYRDRIGAGSYLAVSHASLDDLPSGAADVVRLNQVYAMTGTRLVFRSAAQVSGLFDGLVLCEPGVVPVPEWRPDRRGVESPGGFGLAGVARKRDREGAGEEGRKHSPVSRIISANVGWVPHPRTSQDRPKDGDPGEEPLQHGSDPARPVEQPPGAQTRLPEQLPARGQEIGPVPAPHPEAGSGLAAGAAEPVLEQVAVIGLGQAGLPLAVAAATAGHTVWGLDIDPRRVAAVNTGISPVDTVTAVELVAARGRLTATSDPGCLAGCAVIVVCVPTPVDNLDRPDLGPLLAAAGTVRDHLRAGQLVVVQSTTYPGCTDGPVRELLEQGGLRAGLDFGLGYSPERIDPGNPRFNLANNPRVVAGLTEGCLKQTAAFFARFGSVHPTRGLREAEAAKLLENTYRLVNIGLFNEFTRACLSLGVDSGEAIAAAATKPYGFAAFEPGLGAGGHCVPVDPLYLIRTTGAAGGQLPISRAAVEVNKTVPGWMAERICLELGKLAGASVLLLGVSYKPDCADMRNSPAIRLAELLQAQGVRLFYHDPYVPILHLPHTGMLPVPDLPAALATADLTVLATRHRCYTPELLAAARRLFDTRAATSGAWPVSKAAER